jgi:hypothetical protein
MNQDDAEQKLQKEEQEAERFARRFLDRQVRRRLGREFPRHFDWCLDDGMTWRSFVANEGDPSGYANAQVNNQGVALHLKAAMHTVVPSVGIPISGGRASRALILKAATDLSSGYKPIRIRDDLARMLAGIPARAR